jgi:cell pole-organizing protein PopZ
MSSSDMNRDLSVEEILQSIRNVIHNTHVTQDKRHTPEVYDDILELTDEHHIASSNENNDILLDEKASHESSDLLRDFISRAEYVVSESSHKHSKTIEELVTDMLKPELSKWLNLHLPKIIRELVEQELKRIVPKNH